MVETPTAERIHSEPDRLWRIVTDYRTCLKVVCARIYFDFKVGRGNTAFVLLFVFWKRIESFPE